VSSSSARCVQTLEPYAAATGRKLRTDHLLSEEDATRKAVRRVMGELLDELHARPASAGGLVVCSHRPVLPWVFDAAGVEDPELAPGDLLVLHLRDYRVVAAERHRIG
jgi:8-oxo-(d)GTP phosphatase